MNNEESCTLLLSSKIETIIRNVAMCVQGGWKEWTVFLEGEFKVFK